MAHEKIRLQENELLKKERSLRRSRVGVIGLILLFALAIPAEIDRLSKERNPLHDPPFFLWGTVILLGVLGYQYHLQIKHIDSIKMYRQKTDALKQTKKNETREIQLH